MIPCDNCIEFECEEHGEVCPLWEKYNGKEADKEEVKKNDKFSNKLIVK